MILVQMSRVVVMQIFVVDMEPGPQGVVQSDSLHFCKQQSQDTLFPAKVVSKEAIDIYMKHFPNHGGDFIK